MIDIFEEARKFIAEGKIKEAIVLYSHIVQRLPEFHEARHDLARLLIDNGEVEHAVEILDIGLSQSAAQPSLLYMKGIALMQQQKFANALHCFKEVEKVQGLSTPLVLNIAMLYRELNMLEDGVKLLQEWLQSHASEAALYSLLAELYMEKQEWSMALSLLQQGLQIDTSQFFMQYLTGVVYSRLKRWMEAIPVFRALLERDASNDTIMHELGYAYMQVNHLEGAIDLLLKCFERNSVSVDVLFDLAQAYAQVPDFAKALFYAEKAVAIDPYDASLKELIQEIQNAKTQYESL